MKKTFLPFAFSLLVFFSVFTFLEVSDATALPSWSRKYGMDCATCHAPAVPKLNATGHRFRKMGYRFEHEIGQTPEYKEIGNYISMRGRTRYRYEDPETGDVKSRFEFHDATLFYAGAITKNLTSFFELEWEDSDEINLVAFISWFVGTPERYWTLLAGQFHVLQRVGWAGFDRPIGITSASIFDSRSLTDSTIPFRLRENQKGIEFSYGFNQDARFIAAFTNGINFDGNGNKGSFDDDTDKDFLLAYEQMIGDEGSGFTLFTYRGVFHEEPGTVVGTDATGADIALGKSDDETQFDFWRFGATGAYADEWLDWGITEIIGGYAFSLDELPDDFPITVAGKDDELQGHAFFFELDQHLPHESAMYFRSDFVKPDKDLDFRQRYTFGGVYTVVDYLRLTTEIFFLNEENKKDSDEFGVLAEAMVNF